MTAVDLAAERIAAADAYLASRTGCYEWRCERYDTALEAMYAMGLDDSCTVFDVGSGWGEFGVRLHEGRNWGVGIGESFCLPIPLSRARYVPVDAAIDGTDLETWQPPRRADFFVALEVIEHLRFPFQALTRWMRAADRGVVLSTPNPETVDVLGIDATHVTPIERPALEAMGFTVEARSFYGKTDDSLFAVWSPKEGDR